MLLFHRIAPESFVLLLEYVKNTVNVPEEIHSSVYVTCSLYSVYLLSTIY